MIRPQHGIFAEGTRAHHHLEFSLVDGVDDAAVARALGNVRTTEADNRANGGVHLVIGLNGELWARMAGASMAVPAVPGFGGYRSPDGNHEAPATQRDLWVWAHGPSPDVVLDAARGTVDALRGVADLRLDLPAFVYRDSRDLTGFVDGTANPPLDDAATVATVDAGRPGAGGSCAMTMQFEHDLTAFDALGVPDQEKVFGRTKDDSTELTGDDKPADAHIARAEVSDDDGDELQVYRRSVPWASAGVQGLHFVSFGPDVHRFDLQLRSMFGLTDDGLTDRLLDFTRPMTGSFWFCPSADDLDQIAPLTP